MLGRWCYWIIVNYKFYLLEKYFKIEKKNKKRMLVFFIILNIRLIIF